MPGMVIGPEMLEAKEKQYNVYIGKDIKEDVLGPDSPMTEVVLEETDLLDPSKPWKQNQRLLFINTELYNEGLRNYVSRVFPFSIVVKRKPHLLGKVCNGLTEEATRTLALLFHDNLLVLPLHSCGYNAYVGGILFRLNGARTNCYFVLNDFTVIDVFTSGNPLDTREFPITGTRYFVGNFLHSRYRVGQAIARYIEQGEIPLNDLFVEWSEEK